MGCAWIWRWGGAAATHGGGLSGRPSDLSFRWRSALVRMDLAKPSWVMFSSGCCWMNPRIVSCKHAESALKAWAGLWFSTTRTLTSYAFCCSRDLEIHFSLFLSGSCVHCLPRLSLISLVVAWCHKKTFRRKKFYPRTTKHCDFLCLHLGVSLGRLSFHGCTKAVEGSWVFLGRSNLSWLWSPQGLDVLPYLQTTELG